MRAFLVFGAILLSAMSLSAVFSTWVVRSGLPDDALSYILTSLQVTVLVAFPLAMVAAQHSYKIDQYRESLEAFASTDGLTGLLNRRYFEHAAEDELVRMRTSDYQGAIAVFKLDNFKEFNDAHGHAAGDAVLRSVAEIAYSELRGPFDKLARRGGAEFLILLSNLTLEQAIGVCERIATRISKTRFKLAGVKLEVTTCFGVAHLLAESEVEDVIMEADAALKEAQKTGPNRVYSSIGPGSRVRLVLVN